MAELITRVPESLSPLIRDIKAVKEANNEPSSRKVIMVEALKTLHKKVCK